MNTLDWAVAVIDSEVQKRRGRRRIGAV